MARTEAPPPPRTECGMHPVVEDLRRLIGAQGWEGRVEEAIALALRSGIAALDPIAIARPSSPDCTTCCTGCPGRTTAAAAMEDTGTANACGGLWLGKESLRGGP